MEIGFRHKRNKALSLLTAGAVCLSLSGCFGVPEAETTGNTGEGDVTGSAPADTALTTTGTAASAEPAVSPASAAAIASEDERSGRRDSKPLVVGLPADTSAHPGYSPFFTWSEKDEFLHKATGVTLLGRTRSGNIVRNGIKGETEKYNDTDYTYRGIADVSVTPVISGETGEENGQTLCSFTLSDGLKFSDGEPLTADDVIFTLYAHLDPSEPLTGALYSSGISGAENYYFDSPIADRLTQAEIEAAESTEEFVPLVQQYVIQPALEQQYQNVLSLYGDPSYDVYTETFPDPLSLFVFFYSIEAEYTAPEGASPDTVIEEVAAMYGGQYKQFASMALGDDTACDEAARSVAIKLLTEQYAEARSGTEDALPEHVTAVSGIEKTGDLTFDITVNGSADALLDALCDIVIAPVHYYGENYDYDSGSFGFEKGSARDTLSVKELDSPLGAGAFKLVGSDAEGVTLEANEHFFRGTPATAGIRLVTADISRAAELIADGTLDICPSDGSKESFAAAEEANRSLEKVFSARLSGTGYGYIILNAKNVSVGGEPVSDRSIALRKAIASAIAYFRQPSAEEYYGSYARVIDYPVTPAELENAPETGVTDEAGNEETEYYSVPFSTDADGEPIYTKKMSDSERYEALKTACAGFLAAAGYEYDENGQLTPPEGGKTEFEAIVGGGGNGAHPAYGALRDAAELLAELGITLNIADTGDIGYLWDKLGSGTAEIFAAADGELSLAAFTETMTGLPAGELEKLVTAARDEGKYMELYSAVTDEQAVQIPFYERVSVTLFSTLRTDVSTVPADMTGAYGWRDELYAIGQKQ